MSNKYEATFHPSDGPTDQGAREALVEHLAEAMRRSPNGAWMTLPGPTDIAPSFASAVLPVVDAEVEAAVSVVRAERDEARRQRDFWQEARDNFAARAESAEADLRALREGLEALAAKWAGCSEARRFRATFAARHIRALLAPSPAEGTGDAHVEGDDLCLYVRAMVGEHDAPAPVSSGEAHGPFCPAFTVPAFLGFPAVEPTGPCDCHPAPVVTPSAEDGA